MARSAFTPPPAPDPISRFSRPRWLELTLLFLLLITSTALTYMWFWRLPYWLLFSIASALLLMFPRGLAALRVVAYASRWRIMLPWLAFLGVVVVRDGLAGSLGGSLTDRVLLNGAGLLLFCVCASLSFLCDWRHVLLVLGAVGFIFGLIAIGQFFGSYTFWTLPDALSAYSSRDMALERTLHGAVSAEDIMAGFDRVGRVRALDIYVHKFSAYQGIIAGMMITVAITLWWAERRHRNAALVVAGSALVATLGVLLTFSRAPIFGIICAIMLVFWLVRRQRNLLPLLGLALFVGVLAAAAAALRFGQADQFGRIFEVSTSGSADAGRYETWLYSLRLFLMNPLIGVGSGGMADAELVTHSVPLRILGDFGLAGFTCYFAVWLGLVHLALATLRTRNFETSLVGLVVVSGLVVAVIDNLTHSSGLLQRDTSQAAIFGVGYGLCLRALRAAAHNPTPNPAPKGMVRYPPGSGVGALGSRFTPRERGA